MNIRKLRNWMIGFLLASLLYSMIAYVVIDLIADRFLELYASPQTISTANNKADDKKQPEQKAKQPTVTNDDLEAAQNALTFQEKWTISSILRDKFSQSELDRFLDFADDGLTIAEKKQLRTIFLDTMSEQEYNTLILIAAKYGLSEGKTYNQQKSKY